MASSSLCPCAALPSCVYAKLFAFRMGRPCDSAFRREAFFGFEGRTLILPKRDRNTTKIRRHNRGRKTGQICVVQDSQRGLGMDFSGIDSTDCWSKQACRACQNNKSCPICKMAPSRKMLHCWHPYVARNCHLGRHHDKRRPDWKGYVSITPYVALPPRSGLKLNPRKARKQANHANQGNQGNQGKQGND